MKYEEAECDTVGLVDVIDTIGTFALVPKTATKDDSGDVPGPRIACTFSVVISSKAEWMNRF